VAILRLADPYHAKLASLSTAPTPLLPYFDPIDWDVLFYGVAVNPPAAEVVGLASFDAEVHVYSVQPEDWRPFDLTVNVTAAFVGSSVQVNGQAVEWLGGQTASVSVQSGTPLPGRNGSREVGQCSRFRSCNSPLNSV
jgi:hypothetical protein